MYPPHTLCNTSTECAVPAGQSPKGRYNLALRRGRAPHSQSDNGAVLGCSTLDDTHHRATCKIIHSLMPSMTSLLIANYQILVFASFMALWVISQTEAMRHTIFRRHT